MGSKKYKGKVCAYCATAIATGADHVVCREFFPPDVRGGLPKAPACDACNSRKSELETYLTAVLPFASDHPTAALGQSEAVQRRLNHNPRLRRELLKSAETLWVETHTDLLVPYRMLGLDGQKFVDLCEQIVRGLVWHEWDHVIPTNYVVDVMNLVPEGFERFEAHLLRLSPDQRVDREFASGGFGYSATRNPDDPGLSVWHLRLYGDLMIGSRPAGGDAKQVQAIAFTGPAAIRDGQSARQRSSTVSN